MSPFAERDETTLGGPVGNRVNIRGEKVMARLLDKFNKEIVPALGDKFGRTNRHSLPKLQKIVINMGVGKAILDKNRMEQAVEQLSLIAGQKSRRSPRPAWPSAASGCGRARRSAAG